MESDLGPSRPAAAARAVGPDVLAAVAIFALIVVRCWVAEVNAHEMIYLLGSRRLADPGFLSADFTWAMLSPTTALFDRLLAPLWGFMDAFAIANLGRFVTWAMFAASLAFLGRVLRLPAWSVVAGFAAWLLWGQTLAECGSPLEGFQPKSFAYPLVFMALGFAMRGQVAWAGACAGLATAFHIIVGGWGCLGVFLALVLGRAVTPRRAGVFLLAAAPCVAALLLYAGAFHGGPGTGAEQAAMDRIYVTFAIPHCCDLDYFMGATEWARLAIVFVVAPILIFAWPAARAARVLGAFVVALALFFLAAVLAQRLGLYALLKLYPGQLATGLGPLFLFMFVAAWIGSAPLKRFGPRSAALIALPLLWLLIEREPWLNLIETPGIFYTQASQPVFPRPPENEPLYRWIRERTPRNSVFITPFLADFWPYAERAQVATIRHAPLDRRLIEWRERLEALNGRRPIHEQGFSAVNELDAGEASLSLADLARIRERYHATHYVVKGERPDLAARPLHAAMGYSVYELAPPGAARE